MTLFRASVVFCLTFMVVGCANLGWVYEPPRVKLTSVEILPAQGLNQRFRIGLLMTNPNSAPLPLRGFSYSLALNGYDLLDGVSNTVTTIAAYSEMEMTVEASTDWVAALRFANDLLQDGQRNTLNYALRANLDVGGRFRPVRITETGEVPLLGL